MSLPHDAPPIQCPSCGTVRDFRHQDIKPNIAVQTGPRIPAPQQSETMLASATGLCVPPPPNDVFWLPPTARLPPALAETLRGYVEKRDALFLFPAKTQEGRAGVAEAKLADTGDGEVDAAWAELRRAMSGQ
ncbi:hypothetical protein LTR08_004187 [Meristemomyces frigidus]|nr:hypothetical protein LTR08_004187 [Meristemomyces frigidus]